MMKTAVALAAACGAALLVGLQPAAAEPGSVTCTDAFSGIARDLTVPSDYGCDLSGATITHDVIVQPFAGAFGERLTVGHDFVASEPQTVQTAKIAPDSPRGPVRIGHDLEIAGSPAGFEFVFDGICDLTVGHDLRMTDRWVTLGVGLGDNCAQFGRPANTIGHDLIVTDNSALSGFFGASSMEVGNNIVGHDLIFTGNTAAPGGHLEVSDNVVRCDAVCAGNDPVPGPGDPGDGPNIVGHENTCG